MNQTETNDQNIDAAGAEARAASDQFSLNLTDLLPDANGEIVILNEGDDPRLLESGIADAHVTDGGIEVKGLQYWVFEDGTKLYYSPGLSISVDHPIG